MPYKDKKNQAIAAARHYQKNKKKVKLRSYVNLIKSKARARQHVWDYLCENPCVRCGEKNPIVLQFDHLRDKYKPVSILAGGGASTKKLDAEMAKCQVLCANCHIIKTSIDFEWYRDIECDKGWIGTIRNNM